MTWKKPPVAYRCTDRAAWKKIRGNKKKRRGFMMQSEVTRGGSGESGDMTQSAVWFRGEKVSWDSSWKKWVFFALQEPTRVEFVVVRVETGRFVLAEAGGYPISVSAAHMQARQLTDKSCRTRVVCLQAFIEGREWHGVKTALIGPVNRNKRGNKRRVLRC